MAKENEQLVLDARENKFFCLFRVRSACILFISLLVSPATHTHIALNSIASLLFHTFHLSPKIFDLFHALSLSFKKKKIPRRRSSKLAVIEYIRSLCRVP